MMLHRKPNRLKNYDYSRAGWYFVTICTQKRVDYLGSIINGKMALNRYGEIAQQYWLEIPQHFDIVELDEFVVMPNHVHGIIIIHDVGDVVGNAVGNAYMRSLQARTKMLLSKAVQQYKAAVTREIHNMEHDNKFQWQKSFYDHIIRNDFALFKIRTYIQNNPLKWEFDRENNNEICLRDKKKFWRGFFSNQR